MNLHISVEAMRFHPGETVRGAVNVASGGRNRELTVSLVYRQSTPDFDEPALEPIGVVVHEGDLDAGQTFAFALTVPADAPPNHRSTHGQLSWYVEAHSDRTGPDEIERHPIMVVVAEAERASHDVRTPAG